jgi:decaprenylphospho-beta-D-ribofuranose 2-oxidase
MAVWSTEKLWGWGRYPVIETLAARPERLSDVKTLLGEREHDSMLTFGLGRSYGDSNLLENGRMIKTERLNRIHSFDETTGWLRCEAGVSLKELIDLFVPRGFFPPVVPGTQFVTIGGAIGNDIHGKNHHVDGTFCDHIRSMDLLVASGEVITCGPDLESELFWATVGGLGLTGVILTVDVQLQRIDNPMIEMESIRVENLDHFFEVSAASKDFSHTVSWVDCISGGESMGRGIFMRGRHAGADATASKDLITQATEKLSSVLSVPFDGPSWLMNNWTMRAFNETYYRKHSKGMKSTVCHYEPFFFPLDFVRNWNRIYGSRGMLQYQLVVPHDPQHAAIREVLAHVTEAGMASFLSVIKEFGDNTHGGLSFPSPGVTLAMDFPNSGEPLLALLDRLDEIVVAAGGRIYLGKDARLSRANFRKMYPEWMEWNAVRDKWDPEGVFKSDLAIRLGLVGA